MCAHIFEVRMIPVQFLRKMFMYKINENVWLQKYRYIAIILIFSVSLNSSYVKIDFIPLFTFNL